jgi:hypothetical protein
MAGRLLYKVPRACSTREKRFAGKKKPAHPGECLNECIAMAFKRGKIAGVLSAAAAKGYFTNPEQLEDGDEANAPWTDEQKSDFIARAKAAGVKTAEAYGKLVGSVTGFDDDGDPKTVLQSHIAGLNAALEKVIAEKKPAKAEAATTKAPGDPEPAGEQGDAFEAPKKA